MKKNLYYRDVIARENLLKAYFLSLFTYFTSYTRLLLEVFTRKDFGQRYFRLSSALTLASLLAVFPLILGKIKEHIAVGAAAMNGDLLEETGNDAPHILPHHSSLMPQYLSWYVFLLFFVGLSVKHKKDLLRNPSVFDFAKYSLCSGEIHPIFSKIKIPGIATTVRTVECLYEPLVFFIPGVLLVLIGQSLGYLLLICSLFYGMGYMATYWSGDNFVMDKIDQIILNEELEKAFIFDASEDETRGVRLRGDKPDSRAMRQKIIPLMFEDEETIEAK